MQQLEVQKSYNAGFTKLCFKDVQICRDDIQNTINFPILPVMSQLTITCVSG